MPCVQTKRVKLTGQGDFLDIVPSDPRPHIRSATRAITGRSAHDVIFFRCGSRVYPTSARVLTRVVARASMQETGPATDHRAVLHEPDTAVDRFVEVVLMGEAQEQIQNVATISNADSSEDLCPSHPENVRLLTSSFAKKHLDA